MTDAGDSRIMNKLACSLLILTFSTAAFADEAALPERLLPNIRQSVATADVAAVVTVAQTADAKASVVQLKVEQQLMGTMPTDVTVPVTGFFQGDLVAGTKLLAFFRKGKARKGQGEAFVGTGHYELISDGKIREVPEAQYLEATKAEIARSAKARDRHAAAKTPEASVTTAALTR